MKITVIHHSADFDGLFCREIAKKFFSDKPEYIVDYIGWDYGNPTPEIPGYLQQLYMLDISIDGLMNHSKLNWIDHHKSAMEKYSKDIQGFRIDGVAACRLAYQYFFTGNKASKQEFIDRKVSEPWAVRLAGEYDIWDKRDTDAELFQHGLRSEELYSTTWDDMLNIGGSSTVVRLLNQGKALQYAQTKQNESVIKDIGFDLDWEGLHFLACNHARYNSFLFTAGLKPEHDACFGFKWTGKDWSVSLYHAPGKKHHDLSLIASKYGGGGHRGACGFRSQILPFLYP